jgi:hypothetical protein
MPHIKGISRQQLQVVRLEDTINQDHAVRFIDAFVHRIKLERIGFREYFSDKPLCKRYDLSLNLSWHSMQSSASGSHSSAVIY